jgi:nucleoside-diphosphate-sugar epimerase
MKNQKKYLVIGGDGVLGHALRAISVNFNSTFIFTSRLTTGLPHDTVHLDLSSNFTKFQFSDYSAVIYLAQSREYKNFPLGLADLGRINVVAPTIIAQTLDELGIKFVYCSSGSVYEPRKSPISEKDALKLSSNWDVYSASKILAESAILDINPNNLVLRPFFVFGQSKKNYSLLPALLARLQNESEITLAGIEGLIFNPIYSHDAAKAICHLLEKGESGVFNLSGEEDTSIKKLVDALALFFEISPRYKTLNSEEMMLGDNAKLINTGFRFVGNLEGKLNQYFSEMKLPQNGFE